MIGSSQMDSNSSCPKKWTQVDVASVFLSAPRMNIERERADKFVNLLCQSATSLCPVLVLLFACVLGIIWHNKMLCPWSSAVMSKFHFKMKPAGHGATLLH